jgi:hypothetical protein
MLKGIHLTLMIGPAVPVPAPQFVVEALTSVSVNHSKEHSGFQLSFGVSKKSKLLNLLLPAGYLDPIITRVVIIATLGGIPNVLMDGLVTRQELQPSNEPGQSTLTITGEDLSLAMDLVQLKVPYPALPDNAIVSSLLAKYSALGVVPLVIPPIVPTIKPPTEGWKTQTKTDRAYIKEIAAKCGYVFFVRPGPLPLQSLAYFGPDINVPVPQRALTINMDAHSNVDSLSFALDGLVKKITVYTILDPVTNKIPIPIPVPNISAVRAPLGLRPTPPAKVEFAENGAKMQPDEAARAILASLLNSSQAISGNGSLDVMRYGQILQARMLVGVRGAGIAYDGMYYVESVTHNIKHGEYKQNFTLSRDGLISNTPLVLA